MSKVIQLKDNRTNEELNPIPSLAKPTMVGGVIPIAKTAVMTQPVGIDEAGKLFTEPTGGGEVVVDPIGGLQETDSGLGIKRNTGAYAGSGLLVSNNGLNTELARDGVRGTVIGTVKTDEQTEPVGIGSDGRLYTKPIVEPEEVTVDPNGGLQNSSSGLGIKGDSSATGGPGIRVGEGGTYIPLASLNTRGGFIGVNKTETQTELVGTGSDGKIYTNPIPKYAVNPIIFYLDPENGNNSNDGLTINTPLKTFSALIAKTPEFITQVSIYVTGTLTGDLSINNHIDNVYIASTSQDNFNLNGTIWNQFSKNITLRRATIDPSVKTLFRTSCDCSYNLVDCTFNQTYDNSTDSPSDKSLIRATMQCGRIGVNIQGGQFDINALLFASSFVQLLDISLLTPNSASKIAKNLSNNTIGINKTGQIHQVILPEESLMTNMTMPTTALSSRQSYIYTGNNINQFSSDITASGVVSSGIGFKVAGFRIENYVASAFVQGYLTTSSNLVINDDGKEIGTATIMKGHFTGTGYLIYASKRYPIYCQITQSGSVLIYSLGTIGEVTVPSGSNFTVSISNCQWGSIL